ncbi:MAG: hypothetical protein HYT42_02435 [Candidatus Sungbacteria bacterium]|uniref:Magnesium transporter CorA family protein n=1 Tax=Candidatus Sungiibacteriota bacterium TaxID=2750080 RepID=A0A932YVS9_9BACT|nr:hypothetical protein [Candidatus Sungbacteria bacterium]MBI4132258.1 hypothetical protein [Candidatus Sungbacteria bacterium]
MKTLKTKALEWHNFVKPSGQDTKWLQAHMDLHPLVADELTKATFRPRVDRYDGYLYVVLHFPIFNEREKKTYAREVDFILTKQEIITVAHEPVRPLDDFFKRCSEEQSSAAAFASKSPVYLFFYILKDLYTFALRELDHIQEHINKIEERVFASEHEEEAIIEDLSFVRRDIIDFRRSLKPQQAALESLAIQGTILFGSSSRPFFEELLGEYQKVWNLLENSKEATDALYENNATVLSIKQNEAMKIVAIMAFITFPLMLFTALFSMDTAYTPIIGTRNDFWIIVGIMLLATIGMFAFFKRKKWL